MCEYESDESGTEHSVKGDQITLLVTARISDCSDMWIDIKEERPIVNVTECQIRSLKKGKLGESGRKSSMKI